MPELLAREQRGSALLLRLERPEVRNALSADLVTQLLEALREHMSDSSVRSVILTGAGKDFCAGADLDALRRITELTFRENLADSQHLAALFRALHTYPKPVIAAVHGNALAGGSGLACVCDFTYCESDSRFGFTEARIGFVAAIVARFLALRVGFGRARELLLTGRRFTAVEALEYGVVDEVAPPGGALERALAQAHELEQCSPSSLRLTKELLAALPSLDLDRTLDYAAELNARTRATDDCREGVRAFFEKRKPAWCDPAP